MTRSASDILACAAWDTRRVVHAGVRRFGMLAIALPASVLICAAAVYYVSMQSHIAQGLLSKSLARAKAPIPVKLTTGPDRARVTAFENLLVAQDDIPDVVEDVMQAANEAGVMIPHADYQAETDLAGGFVRFRMTLPVKGEAIAIVRFMHTTLLRYRTMTLESVRLTRQRPEASEVEARVQWVLLTKAADRPAQPADGGGHSSSTVAREER